MTVGPVLHGRQYWSLYATNATKAVIFYPGAKIDSRAYIPLWDHLKQRGFDVHVVIVPLAFAIIPPETVGNGFSALQQEGGKYGAISLVCHSAGGAGISSLLTNPAVSAMENIKGMVSIAGGTSNIASLPQKQMLIYDTRDIVTFNPAAQRANMRSDATTVVIPGGSHYQHSGYDFLPFGDHLPTISREMQHLESL